jgi:hypothetical protein
MNIIYLGADTPSNRILLEQAGATYMGISYYGLTKRGLPKTKRYLIEEHFSTSTRVFVHAGLPKNSKLNGVELEAFSADYEDFVLENMDRITLFTEFDHQNLTSDFVEKQRKTVWASVPPGKFLPVWQSATNIAGLKQLVEKYLDVGLRGDDIETITNLASFTRTYTNQHMTRFHAIGCAKPDNLRQIKVETASSLAWLSPMMRGETIVWDGRKIVRYPQSMKEQARSRYKSIYEKAGLDFDKIMGDDPKEISKLAVWSYDQLELGLTMSTPNEEVYDTNKGSDVEDSGEITQDVSVNKPNSVRNPDARNPEEYTALPVFGYQFKEVIENENGVEVIKQLPVVQSRSVSLRQCNTCFIAANCPAYKQDSECSFSIPIEVKTKEQLKGLINAMIEMQAQRVGFMRYSEELNGGNADPNTSQEIDRLFKILKTVKDLDDTSSFIRMTVEQKSAGGVMSAIFGDKAQALKELPNGGLNEEQTTKIIKDLSEG